MNPESTTQLNFITSQMDYGNWYKIIYNLIASIIENFQTGRLFRQLNNKFFMRLIIFLYNTIPK